MRRAIGFGMLAALVFVAVAVVAAVVMPEDGGSARDDEPRRVLLVLEGRDEAGLTQAQVVLGVDASASAAVSYDPLSTATVPGTSGTMLRDAYAFGGAAGVATALEGRGVARFDGWVALSEDVWCDAVDDAGGLEVEVPRVVDAFTGERLYSFEPGKRVMDGDACAAYLRGLGALRTPDAQAGRRALVSALSARSSRLGDLGGSVGRDGARTSGGPEQGRRLMSVLFGGLGQAELEFDR